MGLTLKDPNGTLSESAKTVATIVATFLSTATLFLMIMTPLLSGLRSDTEQLEIKQDVKVIREKAERQATDIAVIKERMTARVDY